MSDEILSYKNPVVGAVSPAKSRHWFVNTAIGFGIVCAVIMIALGFYMIREDGWLCSCGGRFWGLLSVVAAAGGCMVWQNNRIGFWLVELSLIVGGITSSVRCDWVVPAVVMIVAVCAVFGILQVKKDGVAAWKQTGYGNIKSSNTLFVCIAASVLSVIMTIIPSRLQDEAEAYFPDYLKCVETCQGVLRQKEHTVQDLLNAKNNLARVLRYEDQYRYVDGNHYDKSSSIRSELENLMKTESEKWSKAASMQRRLGNRSKAEEFEKLASQLNPDEL